MRKIICIVTGAAVVLAALGLSACGGKEKRCGYVINAEYVPETRQLTAEMTVTVPNNTENAWEELKFELWANAYREGATYSPVSELYESAAYYKGKSYGGIEISSVTGGEGYTVCGEDENILSVKLASPLYPDETATVTIAYTVTLAEINHRLGVGMNTVNLTAFYPVLCYAGDGGFKEYVYASSGDPFVSECADFDVTLTVPEGYTAVYGGSGEEVAQNGKKAYHVIAENARDTAFVLGQNFECVKMNTCGVDVEYYYYGDAAPERTLSVAGDALKYFSETFGEYTFPRYVVVESDFPYGGMEYAGLSLISSSLRASEIPVVVAHETAHQWWYSMVGSNQFECSWQDEGLAEYSTALFLEAYPDYGGSYRAAVDASVNAYRAFFSVYSQLHGEANTAMNRPLTSFSGDYEYRNIAYDKGVVLFDRVREVMGEKKFLSALNRYVETYRGKIATYADLVACFEGASRNIEGVFGSFVDGLCVI